MITFPAAYTTWRSLHMDTLRGIAVFGILLVNIWGFVWGVGSFRYGVLSEDASGFDQLAIFFVALVAETKFYPIFAFLFGAGFALHTRSLRRAVGNWEDAKKIYRRRLWWLMGCGMLHGMLLWPGEILLCYGIAGFCILSLAGAPLRKVQLSLWRWLIAFLGVFLLLLLFGDPGENPADRLAAMETARAIYTDGTFSEMAKRRVEDYAWLSLNMLFMLPHVVVLFILGIFSVRMGWMSRPKRHAGFWRKVRLYGFAIGIPFNLLFASVNLATAGAPLSPHPYGFALVMMMLLGGPCLASAYIASIMLAAPHTLTNISAWLAPVGRMALTNYLMQSVLCVLLLQVAGIGAALGPMQLVLVAFSIMLLQALVSRAWLAKNRGGPFELMYRRFSDSMRKANQVR